MNSAMMIAMRMASTFSRRRPRLSVSLFTEADDDLFKSVFRLSQEKVATQVSEITFNYEMRKIRENA
jgi:hypothetical protein